MSKFKKITSERDVNIKVPMMPNFITFDRLGNNSVPVGELSQNEVYQIAEIMKEEFICHCLRKSNK